MHSFNDVFLDSARVLKADLVGGKNNGWFVALAMLSFERSGIERLAWGKRLDELMVQYVRERRQSEVSSHQNGVCRNRLAELTTEIEISRGCCATAWPGYRVWGVW